MNWIKNISKKIKPKISNLFKEVFSSDDFWASCPSCSSVIDRNDIKNNFYCCTKCNEPQQIFLGKDLKCYLIMENIQN